ncbi:hypothetical protein NEIELOOT_01205 [Neisseria elongata subsp. glycolytica ATCC 29315]|uniref:Uncharacterized protein n=1 Tax=Neisseria elongata subsp. glycolytica ATCC 29315 TaxID=546263 RepID=D4DQ68_NEIEG|nr:hypothetical protein NEIELOOT_01205 [Neisseria elongata subsp. glycolytica ATCC 29315]
MPSERFRLFPTVSLPTRITGRRTPPRQYPPSGFKLVSNCLKRRSKQANT